MRSSNATQILSCVIWKQFSFLIKAYHGTAWKQVFRSHLVISTLVAVPKLWFLCSRTCCRDVGPYGTDDKHNLEKHLWRLASTTSTVASLGVARLGWLPSQAKLPKCQSNNKLKPDNPQHKPGSPWENWLLPTTSQLHLFLHCRISV